MGRFIAILGLVLLSQMPVSAQTFNNEASTQPGLSADQLNEVMLPELGTLIPDETLLNDRWYKRVLERVDVFDRPDGNYVRTIEEGFNFITALSEEAGWTQINSDEWVRSDLLRNSNSVVSSFTGLQLPTDLPSDTMIAWALVNMYPSERPGSDPTESKPFIYRYTQLFIYATEEVNGIRWYQVGLDQWVHQHRVAKVMPLQDIPDGVETDRWISIDLYEQVIIAYEGTTPVFSTLIATGLPRWPTYEGLFNIYFRTTRKHMSWGTVGDDFYALEEVPWTMFFDEGRAIHGAYWHDGFGYRRSHGCVNLSITDARWIYDWVADYMGSRTSRDVEVGPAVYVYSSGSYE